MQKRIDPIRSRRRMVGEQIEARGIQDRHVLTAMLRVPRHLFVEEALAGQAYEDHPLPVGHGQTISQPYVVALMTELLHVRPGMKVLEIGTGTGYQTAILAEIGAQVHSVERIPELSAQAKLRLQESGVAGVRFKVGDGTLGWPEFAPYDRIIVTAGGPTVPEPLVEQLAEGGIMVIPVGRERRSQVLTVVKKENGRIVEIHRGAVGFVDLVGAHGW